MALVNNPNSVMYIPPVLRTARRLVYEASRTSSSNTIPLNKLAFIEMGQSPSGNDCSSEPKGEPLLNGPTEFGTTHPFPVQWTLAGKKFAEQGDLLFCVRGATAGRTNWADQKYAVGRGLAAIRGNSDRGDIAFIYHMLRDRRDALASEARGSTFMNMGKQLMNTLPMPNIDFNLQQTLGRFLNSVENYSFQSKDWIHQLASTQFADIPRMVARIEELAGKVEEARELRSQAEHVQRALFSASLSRLIDNPKWQVKRSEAD